MHEIRKFKTLTLDMCCKAIEIGNVRQRLTAGEFAIMELFTRIPGVLFDRQQIMNRVFGENNGYYIDRVCDSHMKRLRRKGVVGIVTHYGSGYGWDDVIPLPTKRAGMNTRPRTTIIPKAHICSHCGAPFK